MDPAGAARGSIGCSHLTWCGEPHSEQLVGRLEAVAAIEVVLVLDELAHKKSAGPAANRYNAYNSSQVVPCPTSTAGTNDITIDGASTLTATLPLSIANRVISIDLSSYATDFDLSAKQDNLTINAPLNLTA